MSEIQYRFLFIHSVENQIFGSTLKHVLATYGSVEMLSWNELNTVNLEAYDLIFLDAGILADMNGSDNLTEIISLIQTRSPEVKLIIVTTSPTWRRAKEALQAGAIDYIRQTLDEGLLRREIEASLGYYIDSHKKSIGMA